MVKILLVDDSVDLLDFFEVLLERRGYEVQTESSIRKVHDRLSAFSPDLIILDVLMGSENSRKLCAEIKKQVMYKHIPVILISASPELLKNYEECGAIDAIEKPFDINTVYEKIEAALAYSPLVKH